MDDLTSLAADLSDAPRKAARNVRKAVEVTARYVRDDWREPLKGSQYVPAGAYSVTYDVTGGAGLRGDAIVAEIGPELARNQASIVGILEMGTPTTGPRGFGLAALQKNQGDFERGLAIAIEEAIGEGA
jgi:hypothetical protein